MSLFKVKEFWHCRCESDERFDHKSLKISRLNDDYDCILTCSHNGILRIYKPSTEYDENGLLTEYKANDVLLEKEFPFPILQIDTGRLASGAKTTQIILLHPRSIGVYSLIQKDGNTEHGAQNTLSLLYEHKLKRSAFNMVIGPFGGSINRDFICIQSLDGMLTFFEQECFGFCCFLSNFLIPGLLVYNKRTDYFVTFSSNWCIESYSYKKLSESGQNSNQEENTSGKVTCNWSYGIGEEILDMKCLVSYYNTKESFIVILGERNLYCLNDNGSINFMKRLEYPPSCFNTYFTEDKLMITVVSETHTVLIYERSTLKWAAVLPILPICIDRAFLKSIRGAICLLTEDGYLELCYLGTEPNLFTAPPILNKQLEFDKAEVELKTLNRMLKSSYTNDLKLAKINSERELVIALNVNPHIEDENLLIANKLKLLKTCTVIVDVTPQAIFEEVHLSFNVQKPLIVTPKARFFRNLSDRTQVMCKVYLENELDVSSLNFDVNVSFITNLGVPRVIRKFINLPLRLIMDTCNGVKDNDNKIILNINKSLVPLSTLFPEFAGENSLGMNSNVVAFTRSKDTDNNVPVTILTAKSSQRYRLQCDSIISMTVLVEEMIRRLKEHYVDEKDFEITLGSQLPTNKIVDYIKVHFESRKNVVELEEELVQVSAQFRLIQKRLISKFKDKNPTSLSNLEMLLKDTYIDIMRISGKIEEERVNLFKAQIELSCCLNLIVHLLKLMEVKTELSTFESIFSPFIYDLETQNWEDIVDAGLCYVLRTILAKSDKDRLRAAHTSFDEVKDMNKLEKHFVTVIERISKKGPMLNVNITDDELSEVKEQSTNDTNRTHLLPIGSQFGESSSRALSARRSLLQRRNRVVEEN